MDWLSRIWRWPAEHPAIFTGITIASVVMFIGGILAIPWLIGRIPTDFFIRRKDKWRVLIREGSWKRFFGRLGKNLFGVVLALAGLVMLFTPGQGILALILGLALLDFPKKRDLLLTLVRRPKIQQTIDRIRRKRGKEPLELSEKA